MKPLKRIIKFLAASSLIFCSLVVCGTICTTKKVTEKVKHNSTE